MVHVLLFSCTELNWLLNSYMQFMLYGILAFRDRTAFRELTKLHTKYGSIASGIAQPRPYHSLKLLQHHIKYFLHSKIVLELLGYSHILKALCLDGIILVNPL